MEGHLGIPKRKVIRVESKETQDSVRESLNQSREAAEEVRFVPSAISIPQRPMFWCDNRCSDRDGKGSGAFEELAVEGSQGKEGASWQTMENAGERPVYTRKVGILFA